MLQHLWPSPGHEGTKFIVAIRDGVVKHHEPADTDDAQALAGRLDAEGWDVYFAPASFDGHQRTAAQARTVPGLWMDLDTGENKLYETAEAAMAGLVQWLGEHNLPQPTHVVHSGYGLHVYWLFDAPVPVEQWREAADRFKRAAAVARVCDDLGVIADAARILRVPGTHNHKAGEQREVRVLHETDARVRLDDILSALPELGPKRTVRRADDEWAVDTPLPPGDAPVIAEKCAQMRRIRDEQGRVPEPLWRAGLSILWRCEDREHYIHEWSKGDPRYDADQTQRKAEATGGPAGCQHFAECEPEGCMGCPLKGKITSPILISVAPEPVPEAPGEEWRLNRTKSFSVTSGGVWFAPDGEAAPKQITQVPVWVVEVRERAKRHSYEGDASSLLVEWVGVDGRTKRAVVQQSDVFSLDRFKSWAASENLAAAVTDWKLLVMYISQYTLESIKRQGSRRYHETLGWHADGFVTGNQLVTPEGVEAALIQSSNPIGQVKPAEGGSWEGWAEGMAHLDRPCYLLHQFVVQAGFGSALLEPAGLNSAVITLVGPPGTGKTLSANAALSIYGNPANLRQGANSSPKAIEKQLGANRNVPYLIDEITQFTPKQAGAICYMAANGQGDAKLTRGRENFAVDTWQLVPFATSNRPLTDYSQTQFTDAHRARLVELYMGDAMARTDGAAVYETVEKRHYGHAGTRYLQWVVTHRDEIKTLIADAQQQLGRQYAIPDAHRFCLWTLAAAWVGGAVARSLGLIPWDPEEAVKRAAKEVSGLAGRIQDANELAQDVIREWIAEHNDSVVFWELHDKIGATLVRDPIARVLGDGTIALHRKKVNDLLADNGISRRAADKLFQPPAMVTEKRITLAPGTSPVWAYILTEESVEFTP